VTRHKSASGGIPRKDVSLSYFRDKVCGVAQDYGWGDVRQRQESKLPLRAKAGGAAQEYRRRNAQGRRESELVQDQRRRDTCMEGMSLSCLAFATCATVRYCGR
jgi:hypothetical protein